MTDESITLVVNKLEGLAQSIGIGVQEMFPYFVKQQYIDSLSSLIPFILLIITLPLFIHFNKKANWDNSNWDTDQISCVIFSIIFIATVIGTLVCLDSLLKFLNPEYHAIREIIRLIR